ncbi:MAG: hypothetical protein Q7T54_05250 [Candidatus Levybacteria bacterium]|nr:hypothetical protein [Candidatus Levybacteria bacterium]
MKDPVVQKSELIIDALQYAHDHELDVHNKDDVQKILDVLDPEHKQDIDEFAELLKTSDVFMGMKAREKESQKTNLPN